MNYDITMKMKIGVTSENKIKINAVINAYAAIKRPVHIVGYSTASGVGEQPVNEQALIGARNRIANLRKTVKGLERIVSIENGIFKEGSKWVDRAVVVILDTKKGKEYVAYSEGVIFPAKYVEMARAIGFDKTTVGKVMAEHGYVADAKDPHISISGISRQKYIENTMKKLVKEAEEEID